MQIDWDNCQGSSLLEHFKELFALTTGKWLLVGYIWLSTSSLEFPGGMAGKKSNLLKYDFLQHISNLLLVADI